MNSKFIYRLFIFTIFFGIIHSCVSVPPLPAETKRESTSVEIEKDKTSPTKSEPQKEEVQPTKIEPEKPKESKILVSLPNVNREFRAAWIASVANINWPSKRGLSVEQQKAEATAILDVLKDNNFNAVILQIRPSADALYDSKLEPWSIFLTGETGKAPVPYYDPLEFWISEAHLRGMELHAWLNPYRVHHTNGGKVNSHSMANKMPNDVIRLKNGMYWFDPAKKSTQNHVSNVVMDIVKRYDIDGIHFDDYFYPYTSYNGGADFPDQDSWNAYVKSGGKLSKADWRRDNVNQFIQRIYTEIKSEKNWVKFGISPFGIWKSGIPNGITGLSQYDELYADAKLWLNEGWIDYFMPQLYWPIDAPRQSFTTLLNWWNSENTHKRHLWPGLNTVEIKSANKADEIVRQIKVVRDKNLYSSGEAHWSFAGLNFSMLNALKSGPYKEKALIPKSPWLHEIPMEKPELDFHKNGSTVEISWDSPSLKNVTHWVIYLRYGDQWEIEILEKPITGMQTLFEKNGKKLNTIAVQSIDRIGNESEYEAKNVK
ncbi:MAG: family 10 glycosylhydrolase [Weeksellaceae bacterium]|nr:family 10 glycosylhydrolase [Weeksellaceae bacterium]